MPLAPPLRRPGARRAAAVALLSALASIAALAGCERDSAPSAAPGASAQAASAASSPLPPSPPPPSAPSPRPADPPFACTPVEPIQLSVAPKITPDASDKLRARCGKLGEARDKLVAAHPLASLAAFQSHALAATGACQIGAKGAWALELQSLSDAKDDRKPKDAAKGARGAKPAGGAKGTKEGKEPSFEGRYALVYVRPDGTLERGFSGSIAKDGLLTRTAKIEAAADVDGDGVDEVLVYDEESYADEDRKSHRRLFGLSKGKIAPFAPAEGMTIERVRDVDGDGLADLVIESPFVVKGPCGIDGVVYRGPSLLARSTRGGALVTNDTISRAYARVACPHNPNAPLVELESPSGPRIDAQATVSRVACALLWGITPSQVQSRLASDYAAVVGPGKLVTPDNASCQPLSVFDEVARIKPPFTLDGCPAEVTP